MSEYSASVDLTGGDEGVRQPPASREQLEKEAMDRKSMDDMSEHIQNVLQGMREKFQMMSEQILSKIDDMGSRIDDLEKNISDLMTHAGLETPNK